jgi:hypothetical protein
VRELLVKSDGTCLIPITREGLRWVMLAAADTFLIRVVRERSVAHHRKFFALVKWVSANHPVYDTTAKALDAVKLAAGHVTWVAHPVTGELTPIPKSICFDQMSQDEFETFYEDAIKSVLEHLAPDVDDREAFVAEVARF